DRLSNAPTGTFPSEFPRKSLRSRSRIPPRRGWPLSSSHEKIAAVRRLLFRDLGGNSFFDGSSGMIDAASKIRDIVVRQSAVGNV
ncbi:unnamed protein product, partial [Ectocarpus fasciculatus]